MPVPSKAVGSGNQNKRAYLGYRRGMQDTAAGHLGTQNNTKCRDWTEEKRKK